MTAARAKQSAGARFRAEVGEEFADPDAVDRRMVDACADTLDLIAGLEAAVAADGPVLADGRLNPAVAELRQQRLALSRLLARLRPETYDQKRNRKAAASRASRGRG